MATLNRVELIGYLGTDPEVRFVNSSGTVGKVKVASFRLSTRDNFTGKGGETQNKTEWHNVVCWARLADLVENYTAKGSQIYVSGRLRTREWIDSEGKTISRAEVVAENVQLLGPRPQRVGSITAEPQIPSAPADPSDDMPF